MVGRTRVKVINLFLLVRFFESGGEIDSAKLARQYGVSVRTAERWLLDVGEIVPLTSEGRRWRRWRP